MKVSHILSLGIFSALLFSCATVHDRLQTGTIVRDCTGTYLRVAENEDYNEIVIHVKFKENDATFGIVLSNHNDDIDNADFSSFTVYEESPADSLSLIYFSTYGSHSSNVLGACPMSFRISADALHHCTKYLQCFIYVCILLKLYISLLVKCRALSFCLLLPYPHILCRRLYTC